MAYKYLFGPVPSRRLGLSLGIDLVPYKFCSMNCLYCEAGRTTCLTTERREYVPVDEVLAEIGDYLNHNPHIDYLTFSGAGEPTLHSKVGEIINFLKKNYSRYKIAMITNSSLLWNNDLRRELLAADMILPSLDAATEATFRKINRPDESLKLQQIIEGLIAFRENYQGKMWLEIFFIPGINDSEEELSKFVEIVELIKPDEVQLNSLDRPGTESWVTPMSREKLESIALLFKTTKAVIIARKSLNNQLESAEHEIDGKILATIRRRPCTVEDLVTQLNISHNTLLSFLENLQKEGRVCTEEKKRGLFYKIDESAKNS